SFDVKLLGLVGLRELPPDPRQLVTVDVSELADIPDRSWQRPDEILERVAVAELAEDHVDRDVLELAAVDDPVQLNREAAPASNLAFSALFVDGHPLLVARRCAHPI